jgi:hypothetical protein
MECNLSLSSRLLVAENWGVYVCVCVCVYGLLCPLLHSIDLSEVICVGHQMGQDGECTFSMETLKGMQ